MSKILDALNAYSTRVEANAAPDDEKRPVVLNLSVESNYGTYKFVPILPVTSTDVIPFITAHFNEVKLHIKGAKFDSWRRVISLKDIDSIIDKLPENDVKLLKTCHSILKDIDKMKDESEFHKVTRSHLKTKDRDTLRFKTYVIWYAYILEAKDPKGNTLKDHEGKFRLMVMPSAKMETAVNACFKTVMDNYESPMREEKIESLFSGGIENRKDYFSLSVTRPKNYEITLTPVIWQPGVKVNIPEKLISDAGYANLNHPLVEYTLGKQGDPEKGEVYRPYNVSSLELIKKTFLERMNPPEEADPEGKGEGESKDDPEKPKDPGFKIPETKEDPFKN